MKVIRLIANSRVIGSKRCISALKLKQSTVSNGENDKFVWMVNKRSFHLTLKAMNEELSPSWINNSFNNTISEVKFLKNSLEVQFIKGLKCEFPFAWLRDNCQCQICFDSTALGRKFLLQDLNPNLSPVSYENHKHAITIHWNDDHYSTFDAKWLFDHSFMTPQRSVFKSRHKLERVNFIY